MKTSFKISIFSTKNVNCFSKAGFVVKINKWTQFLLNNKHTKNIWLEYQREVPLIQCISFTFM